MFKDYTWTIAAGVVLGVISLALVKLGNPANMGFCIACFNRDIAGGLGLFNWNISAPVQYIRPEIIGIVLGAFLTAVAFGEFKPKGGSVPAIRFLLGMFMMIGALVFLGCPTRMILRLGGGDLNALIALLGFIAGTGLGVYLIRSGFKFDAPVKQKLPESLLMPVIMVVLLFAAFFVPQIIENGPVFVSQKGHPGVGSSPIDNVTLGIVISLMAGLVVGFFAQRSRLCFAGGWRDMWLARFNPLLAGVLATLATVAIGNLILGSFTASFAAQPIAHTNHIWNFLGMALVGVCAVLLGGCPFRQVALAGSGSSDAAVVIFGMLAGAAFSHNFMLVSKGAATGGGPGMAGQIAVLIGLLVAIGIALAYRKRFVQPPG